MSISTLYEGSYSQLVRQLVPYNPWNTLFDVVNYAYTLFFIRKLVVFLVLDDSSVVPYSLLFSATFIK